MKNRKFFPLLVIAAGLLAYHNSFTCPFIFDDVVSIQENPTIHRLWPIWQALSPPHRGGLTVEGRPIINLSLAINYALGGNNVWGYHALNLTVHILAGLTLLGIVRRTLLQSALRGRFGAMANELALAVAVLWTVHPLQTESVTYVIQRAESIMGLFYLLTLYCFIRGAESPLVARSIHDEPLVARSTQDEPLVTGNTRDESRARLWYGLSVVACALGMASKEVMVSAPLMVLLYDRAFLSNSFREAWRRRWPLYLALAGTWILLGVVVVSGQLPTTSMNAHRVGLTWWAYLLTEPGVILHYLRLSVWPYPLCLDYGWPIAQSWTDILLPTFLIAILLAASAWAWRANPIWGFVGAWFFLTLAPSSSFIPLESPVFEHRLYLALAAVVVLGVIGIHALVGRRSVVVVAVLAIGLGFLTWRRNQDYRSELAIWQDTAIKRPNNPRAHNSLGFALLQADRDQEAIKHFEQALRIKPDYANAHNNLGAGLLRVGRIEEAIEHFQQVVRIDPDEADAHNNLGFALLAAGKPEAAIPHFEQAVRIKPDFADAHYSLGNALLETGRIQDAIAHYNAALRIKPDLADAHNNLGFALLQAGQLDDAINHCEQALRIKPDDAEAHYNLGDAMLRAGDLKGAIGHFEEAVRLRPDFTEAQNNLAHLRGVR